MTPARVLLTNNTLATRAGSEVYLRDVALALARRGHQPVAYSPILGEVAGDLREAGIPVREDLSDGVEPPQIIHGQHHLETMTALLRFPRTPAVFFCHGSVPWEELPPRFPRIYRYVAVDEACRERLVAEGIPAQRIRLVLNFADCERFRPRGTLPGRPARALLFSNQASPRTHLPAVREACERAGLALDVVGLENGNPVAKPEALLPAYDLVFAKGRAAIEALAVGCAVVLCDAPGVGPMVSGAELDSLRPWNFGHRLLRAPVTADSLLEQISRYDALDAGRVCARIRAEANIEKGIAAILSVYDEALEEHGQSGPGDSEEEAKAAAEYLRRWGGELKRARRRLAELS